MAKQLLPGQCDLLHATYGPNNCCLCQANQRIKELEATIKRLVELIQVLSHYEDTKWQET